MKKFLSFFFPAIFLLSIAFVPSNFFQNYNSTGAPPFGENKSSVPQDNQNILKNWKRPDGPTKVALQVGHWKSEEAPDELYKLRTNTGATGGGKIEWEVNYQIALETKKLLEEKRILVDLLPATIPPKYYADIFIAVHADGNEDLSKTGFKVAAPWRDFSGKADKLVKNIEEEYKKETKLYNDPDITQNMKGYYAFSWWKYTHALHPKTVAVILETGFLTNRSDREIIMTNPHLSANGLANGIIEYLQTEGKS